MYGPPSGYVPQQPPGRRGTIRQSALWLSAAALTLAAAAVVITLVLTGGSGSPAAGRTTTPPTGTVPGPSTSVSQDSVSPGSAPTTDVLPSNAGAASCAKGVSPDLVAVAVASAVGLTTAGGQPNSYVVDVLRDCTSASVRTRIRLLYGIQFGSDYTGDLTGDHDAGPTAVYRVSNAAGTGTLELTLTRQQDGHYEVTAFSYSG